jgi:hypothetical protein
VSASDKIRGIRDQLAQFEVIGRTRNGMGAPHRLSFRELAAHLKPLVGTGQATSGGAFGNLPPPVGADPTATASDAAVPGSALTFMRSDAAPAVQIGSATQFGIYKVDGSTITETSGVISAAGGGSGDVVGPASSTNGDLAQFDGTTGKLLKDGGLSSASFDAAGAAATALVTAEAYADSGDAATLAAAETYTDGTLDRIGSTRGDILYRGSSAWAALAPGTNGQVLVTQGAGANPQWGSASGGFAGAVQVNTYSAAGANTWNKPTNATRVKVILWGPGGGGGGGAGGNSTSNLGGSGGGGGACIIQEFNASDLGSSETVTIGAGGTGGAGGSNATGSVGSTGGNTTFGAHLTGYAGGGGGLGATTARAGGSGGGSGAPGAVGGSSALAGGGPGAVSNAEACGGAGAGSGNASNTGHAAEFGGGAGGSDSNSGLGGQGCGGSSMWGGAAGGAGGSVSAGNGTQSNSAGDGGGAHIYELASATSRTGGARGTSGTSPTAGTAGAAGAEAWGGAGGGGGGANTTANGTGGKGGDGGQRGGGGGGGGAAGAAATSTNIGGAGGKGGDGYAIVVTYF